VPVKEEEIRGEYKTLRSVRKLCCGFKSLRTYVCMRGDWVFFFFFFSGKSEEQTNLE
jgi:hypothetical protein